MNGSKMKHYLVKPCAMLLFFLYSLLFAEEQVTGDENPTIEFLEFLGEWETEAGEWIDPIDLEDDEIGSLIETVIEAENEN